MKRVKVYDLLVIGSGNAAISAASVANRRGLKTALVCKQDQENFLPSDSTMDIRNFVNVSRQLYRSGSVQESDFYKAIEKVKFLRSHYRASLSAASISTQGIDLYEFDDHVSFVSSDTVSLNDEDLKAKYIVVCLQSDSALDNLASVLSEHRVMPKSIIVQSNTEQGLELAQAFSFFGIETILCSSNRSMLGRIEHGIRRRVEELFKADGIIVVHCDSDDIIKLADSWIVSDDGHEYEVSMKVDVSDLGLDLSGLQLERTGVQLVDGKIPVSKYLQYEGSNIYAISPSANLSDSNADQSQQVAVVIKNILEGNSETYKHYLSPWVLQTMPELACVGFSEDDCVKEYGRGEVKVFRIDEGLEKIDEDRNASSYLKVIFNNKDQVLGADAMGTFASDWIQLLSLVIRTGIPAVHVAGAMYDYPNYNKTIRKLFDLK